MNEHIEINTLNSKKPFKKKLGILFHNKFSANKSEGLLQAFIEDAILSLYKRVQEEIRSSLSCVTIYTWKGNDSHLSFNFKDKNFHFGHSALKTYRGGPNGKGIYVSFYPGDCTGNRHNSCHKAVSHFHPINFDKDKLSLSIQTHLYGLNVEAINEAFKEICDTPMYLENSINSKKAWFARYNCSDIVLNLLEQGELYKKINLRKYGWKTVSFLSVISTILIAKTLDFTFTTFSRELFSIPSFSPKNFFDKLLYLESLTFTDKKFGYSHHLRNFIYISGYGILGGLITSSFMYRYYLSSFSKLNLPLGKNRSLAFHDAWKSGLLATTLMIILVFFRECFRHRTIKEKRDYFLMSKLLKNINTLNDLLLSIGKPGPLRALLMIFLFPIIIAQAAQVFVLAFLSILNHPAIKLLFIAGFSTITLVPLGMAFSSSYLYNTTITPNAVLKFISPLEKEFKKKELEKLSFNKGASTLTQNKKIIAATSIIVFGLFAYKNKNLLGKKMHTLTSYISNKFSQLNIRSN